MIYRARDHTGTRPKCAQRTAARLLTRISKIQLAFECLFQLAKRALLAALPVPARLTVSTVQHL